MNKLYFVVEMLRWGDRENHSYVCGVFNDELLALKEAWNHMRFRAGKYDATVTGWLVNGGDQVYSRKLSSGGWDEFAQTSKDLAEKLKPLLDEEH